MDALVPTLKPRKSASRTRSSDFAVGHGVCDQGQKNCDEESLTGRTTSGRQRCVGRYGQTLTASKCDRPTRRQQDDSALLLTPTATGNRFRTRRVSDPGRVSLSPLRGVTQRNCAIAEEGENEDDTPPSLPSAISVGHSRSPSPGFAGSPLSPQQRSRSNSLPALDPRVFEVGEAIGALVGSKIPPVVVMSTLEPIAASLPTPGRRKSVSIESPSLASISEEDAAGRSQRRFSTPNVMLHPSTATSAFASLNIAEPSGS